MNKKLILVTVLGTYFLIMMDTSITMTALNDIKQTLSMSDSLLTWVQSAYVLLFGGLLLFVARLGDVLGLKRIFLTGLLLFLLCSISTGLANTTEMLLFSRAGQGIAAAIVSPSILAFINTIFEDGPEKRKTISIYSAIAGIGASGGLIVGGILTTLVSWRLCFLINIPICVFFIILAIKTLPNTPKADHSRIDGIGAGLSVISILLIILGMERLNVTYSLLNLMFIVIGFVMCVVLILYEKRIAEPMIDLKLFKHKIRSSGYILRFLFLSSSFSYWYYMSIYFQDTFNLSPLKTGLLLIFTTGMNFIVALNIHKLLKKQTNIWILIQGIVISIIGMLFLVVCLTTQATLTIFIIPLTIIGIGQGFVFTPLTNMGVYKVSQEQSGMASGLVNLAHQIGASTGIVFELLIATWMTHMFRLERSNDMMTFIAMIIGLIIQIIMLLYVFIMFKKKQGRYEI
ncbi:MFS transporter [Staphylococcus caeli]|uniref:MFS transporter n=1 Tax=Staphylococcus caeli TaxID=2201815 RepID=UPI003F57D98E